MATARRPIEARVQGVGMRAAAQAREAALGLRGADRNRDDGRVEVLAPGSTDALAGWLAHGPPPVHVTQVERDHLPTMRRTAAFRAL